MAASPLTSLATGGPPHLDAVAYTHDTRTRGKPRQEWGGDTFSGTTARSLPTPVTIPPGGIWWRAERDLNQSGGPSDGSSAGSDRARTGADRVDDLGNPVGADPGLRAVGGGSPALHCGRTPKTWPAAGAVKGAECRQDRWVCSARPRIRTIFAPSASNIAFEERSRQSHWAGANGATRLSSKETPSATEPALGKSVPRTSQGYAKRPRSILTCRPPPANQHSATTRQRGTQCSLPVSAPSPACLC